MTIKAQIAVDVELASSVVLSSAEGQLGAPPPTVDVSEVARPCDLGTSANSWRVSSPCSPTAGADPDPAPANPSQCVRAGCTAPQAGVRSVLCAAHYSRFLDWYGEHAWDRD